MAQEKSVMMFEPLKYNDLDEIRNLQPDGWPDIISDFKFYINSAFCIPIKTRINNKIVGIGTSVFFTNTGWLAHIIVDSNFRQKGIGSQLVIELLKNLEKESVETFLLTATELGRPIYTKLGFRLVSEYTFMRRENPWHKQSFSENVVPFKEEHRSMIYQLDKQISGENREKLLNNYLGNSMVYIENNIVLGYYIPDLKEGPIMADTEDAGLELMKIKYSGIDKAVLPMENVNGIEFLKNNGFVETDTKGTRMILAKDIDWKPEKIFSRIGGNFG